MKFEVTKLKMTILQGFIKKIKNIEMKSEANQKNLQIEIDGKNIEIKQKNDLLERIFSNTHILIAFLDKNFNFIQVNKTYADYNKKSIIYYNGKNYFDIYPDKQYQEIFTKVIETGEPYIVFEEHFNYNKNIKKNDLFWDWSLYTVKDTVGKVDGIILTLLDVTKHVNNQEELEKAKEELYKSKRMSDLGLLAATVAHELRNPLSVILASVYNIDRKKGNIPIENQIRTIEKKVSESEQIISNLLTYAKIKSPCLTNVDILQLLDNSITSIKTMFFDRDIEIVKNIGIDFKNLIMIDSYQIKEVFNNILLNAFQSITKKKGIISISAKTINGLMMLSITDNGSGIKKTDLSKVFEPFFTRKSRGTGLGLSLCYEIVNLHNGKISLESRLLKGTSVFINLPYRENHLE